MEGTGSWIDRLRYWTGFWIDRIRERAGSCTDRSRRDRILDRQE